MKLKKSSVFNAITNMLGFTSPDVKPDKNTRAEDKEALAKAEAKREARKAKRAHSRG